ncbi:MAG: hypothetical protein K9M10_03930 [Candidatus Pacebacteria bacterium]|nr:hypothetical protein [Candidatus Paceibacterota bacterium]MCF7857597.1 hypothetical protein [Candidatus Paceibacterota bacterium]
MRVGAVASVVAPIAASNIPLVLGKDGVLRKNGIGAITDLPKNKPLMNNAGKLMGEIVHINPSGSQHITVMNQFADDVAARGAAHGTTQVGGLKINGMELSVHDRISPQGKYLGTDISPKISTIKQTPPTTYRATVMTLKDPVARKALGKALGKVIIKGVVFTYFLLPG